MSPSADLRLERSFAALGPEFSDPVEPAAFPEPTLRWRNDRIAARIGLQTLSDDEWVDRLGRFLPLSEDQGPPLAMRYHGHQFRTYNPALGDGRGFLLAQVRDLQTGRLLDLGTKGSGRTPWSRGADGRLTLKGAVREALASEMLEALGVPTSKTLSLVETGEQLSRHDEPSPARGAVLTRVSQSHIRFGTFQRLAYLDRADLISDLTEHVLEVYYPELSGGADPAATLLAAVTERTASLAARWTAAGFVHGVLNTDNMSITGESFDYGPYRFLPFYDPGFTAAYFDEFGLYAFGRQAEAVFWNLQQLAGCLALITEAARMVDILNGFAADWSRSLAQAFVRRLGLKSADSAADQALLRATLVLLEQGGDALRWEPLFFDWFGGERSAERALSGARAPLYSGAAFAAFREALSGLEPASAGPLDRQFEDSGPQELLYDEIEAIWAAIAVGDDWAPFHAKLAAIGAARRAYAIAEP